MLSRDWSCETCGHGFHSYDHGEPPCPQCGGRANWVPGGGHVGSEFVKGCDRTVKSLAADYGLTNLNTPSPSRLNRAMPWHPNNQVQPDRSLGMKTFAPGFASYFHPSKPTCTPSVTAPQLRGSKVVGQPLPRSGTIAGPMTRGSRGLNTRIDGRFYPK
jgi:hypothetical protein